MGHSPMSLDIPLLNVCLKQEYMKAVEGTPCKSSVLLARMQTSGLQGVYAVERWDHGENAPPDRGYQSGISLSVVMAVALMTSHNSQHLLVLPVLVL